MRILGIETSCDETAASVVVGTSQGVTVLSNIISSQIDIHKKYGGVVPEVAAREHVLNILPVVDEALVKAGIKIPLAPFNKGGNIGVDAIAVATGPGLVTSLIAGIETAKNGKACVRLKLPKVPPHTTRHASQRFPTQHGMRLHASLPTTS